MDTFRIYILELDLKGLSDGLDVEGKVKRGITEESQIGSPQLGKTVMSFMEIQQRERVSKSIAPHGHAIFSDF